MPNNFDPTIYDRVTIRVQQKSCWYQCEFVLPEEWREKLPLKQLGKIHGKHVVELDSCPLPGYEFIYPPVDKDCPSFYWEVLKVRQRPRRYKSRQPRIVSEVFVRFVEHVES